MPETTVGQHTPGPWTFPLLGLCGPDGRPIDTGDNDEPASSNRRLIAAAPELLTIARAYVDLAAEVGDYDGAMPSLPDVLWHYQALTHPALALDGAGRGLMPPKPKPSPPLVTLNVTPTVKSQIRELARLLREERGVNVPMSTAVAEVVRAELERRAAK